jgi:riboflavin transporter FmnP
MLYYLLQHQYLIFLGTLIPVIAFAMRSYFPRVLVKVLLYVSVALYLPILFGSSYILGYLNLIFLYIIIASYLAISFKSKNKNIRGLVINTVIAFVASVVCIFELNFFGILKIYNKWTVGNYKIEQVEERGFSGGPLKLYQLYEFNSVFIRNVEGKVDNDTTNNCIIRFNYKKFNFDKCKADANSENYLKVTFK